MLLKHVPIVEKRVIDTRWIAHYEAAKALQHHFLDVVSALNELHDQNQNIDTRGQDRGILDAIQRFYFVLYFILLQTIFHRLCSGILKDQLS